MPFRKPAPKLPETVNFTEEESSFLDSIKPWTKEKWSDSFGTSDQNRIRNEIKAKIKTELKRIQDNYCAFCGLNLDLAYEVHREHVAPQYKYPDYIFEPENLVLSCSFCNMFKKKKAYFVADRNNRVGPKLYSNLTFEILHPHRDNFSDYLDCDFINLELIFTIIDPNSGKTQKTINCVGLEEPHLITQRGAIILKDLLKGDPVLSAYVDAIISRNRKRN